MAYMQQHTGMQRHECEAECFRYEAWPGQACAYKIGEVYIVINAFSRTNSIHSLNAALPQVAIWRLRRRAEEVLGGGFDLRRFHTCILSHGPLPLDTLGTLVEEWIEGEKERMSFEKP